MAYKLLTHLSSHHSQIAAAAAGVLYYFFFRKPGTSGIFPNPSAFGNSDPFHALTPSQVNHWQSDGNHQGLQMEVVRATESTWYSYFSHAVYQWDNGIPDALTLTTSSAAYDFSCSPINNKLKVCNGNYGDTKWLGINKVLLINGYIIASADRMNEYYLKSASADQKTYTMCHEMGHGKTGRCLCCMLVAKVSCLIPFSSPPPIILGFGLPHTDETFGNKDLGNCMDYTNNPSVNMQPDTSNYKFLATLYGTVPGSATLAPNSTSTSTSGGRMLRGLASPTTAMGSNIPSFVMEQWQSQEKQLHLHAQGSEAASGLAWQVLHANRHGEAYELDVGQGYSIRVHKLLVQ
jgi:hypothetical protein